MDPRFKIEQFYFDDAEVILFKDALQEECLRNWNYWKSKTGSLSSNTIVNQNEKRKGLSAIFQTEFGSEKDNMVSISKNVQYLK